MPELVSSRRTEKRGLSLPSGAHSTVKGGGQSQTRQHKQSQGGRRNDRPASIMKAPERFKEEHLTWVSVGEGPHFYRENIQVEETAKKGRGSMNTR